MGAENTKPPKSDRVTRRANLLAIAGVTVFVTAFTGLSGRPPVVSADASSVTDVGKVHRRSQESEDTLQLIIGNGGFEPAQVTRRAGKFLLSADDRRGDKSQPLKLRLSREGGELLREIEVPAGATDWAEELELPSGKYVVGEVSHPAWSCNIVVE